MLGAVTCVVFGPLCPLRAAWCSATDLVQLVVEATGVADRLSLIVAAPQRGGGGHTVGTLQPQTPAALLDTAHTHSPTLPPNGATKCDVIILI